MIIGKHHIDLLVGALIRADIPQSLSGVHDHNEVGAQMREQNRLNEVYLVSCGSATGPAPDHLEYDYTPTWPVVGGPLLRTAIRHYTYWSEDHREWGGSMPKAWCFALYEQTPYMPSQTADETEHIEWLGVLSKV